MRALRDSITLALLVAVTVYLFPVSSSAQGIPLAVTAHNAPPSTGKELLVRIEGKAKYLAKLQSTTEQGRYRISPLFLATPFKSRTERDAAWLVATLVAAPESENSWDEAHLFVRHVREGKLGALFDSIDSVYAEPNQKNEVPYAGMPGSEPDQSWPVPPSLGWHLDDPYTQLARARKTAKTSGCTPRLVILDTGIYPPHITTPRQLIKRLQKNFVEQNGDATDPGRTGPLKNPGHGTATIALLSGSRIRLGSFDDDLGGAPDAQVVPVRIADSVVHFWSKEMAQGIDYASSLLRNEKTDYCEVISISMGGVASRAWAHAVNQAYDQGIFIVAAAGNNFGDFPSRYTVYPSRFLRVVTATGATSAYTPYRKDKNPGAKGMQGNFGPPSVMRKAIAAYTPNIAWAEWNTANKISSDGAGTSCATPQVAAAALLWMQAHGSNYQGWQRVEAARVALFRSADNSRPETTTYFGNGLLRAADAIGIVPDKATLTRRPADEVSFPFWRILLGLGEPNEGEERMYEVEALNIAMRSPALSKYTADADELRSDKVSETERIAAAKGIYDDPRASRALKGYIEERVLKKTR